MLNKQKKCDVLVGYAWCRPSYHAIRSLSKLGLRVAAVDSTKFGMGQRSKYTTACFLHTEPLENPDGFIKDIINIIAECKATFYLPGHDEGQIVAQQRDRFGDDVIIPLPNYEAILLANDKKRMAELADDLGVPVPQMLNYKTVQDLENTLSELSSYVIKLRRSSGAKGVFYSQGIKQTIDTSKKLIKTFSLEPDRYPVIQHRVSGQGWGVSCLYWNGERIASFTHHRLREKILTGGTSTLRVSAHNPQMELHAHKILDHLNWHGLAMVEFKWDPGKRQMWFIEINPRLWGSIALPIACGVDFPAMMYVAATEGPEKAKQMFKDYSDGKIARWYLGDLILGAHMLAKCRLLSAFRLVLPGREDVYDDLFWDDIGATAAEFVSYFVRFVKFRSTNPVDRGVLG